MIHTSKSQPFACVALGALLLASLAACGGQQERPEPTGFFATYIDEDGTKKFQYTLDSPFPNQRQAASRTPANPSGHVSGSSSRGVSTGVSVSTASGSGGSNPQRGRELYERINKDLENQLEKSLKDSGYCGSGYQEKERIIEVETILLRGECKDKASAEDRVRFPND